MQRAPGRRRRGSVHGAIIAFVALAAANSVAAGPDNQECGIALERIKDAARAQEREEETARACERALARMPQIRCQAVWQRAEAAARTAADTAGTGRRSCSANWKCAGAIERYEERVRAFLRVERGLRTCMDRRTAEKMVRRIAGQQACPAESRQVEEASKALDGLPQGIEKACVSGG